MPLSPGTKLGPYEILSRIGSGGMGEVWKARDTRLNREVAIKTSEAEFSERFEREARAIAALNHPHICQIYDVGPDYIVMELVDGAPLRGPMPVEKALALAIQLAGALDAAHRNHVTHRDLKPANILNAKSGIKVLDFGLAKFDDPKTPGPDDRTATTSLTREGTIVGSLNYMAPEQVQGHEIDSRTDIFAFGCVFYEMLTGKRAFDGKSTASVVAAILERPAPSVAEIAPIALDRFLKTCLAKDPDDRWQSARDLKIALELVTGQEGSRQTASPSRKLWLWPALATVLTLALAALAFIRFRETPPQMPVIRSTILPPPKTAFQYFTTGSATPVLSPDGRLVAFGARSEGGHSQLYVRPLDSVTAQLLAGTEGASYPFWSPDSRSIGFAAGGKLKKIDASGGPAVALADASTFRGGTWNKDGVIVFSPSTNGPLQKVAAAGGTASDVSPLSVTPGATSHRWPWFLPDGRHFLYLATVPGSIDGEIQIGSLDAGERGHAQGSMLGKANSQPVYSPGGRQGYLLFLREQTLVAQAFDPGRFEVTGEAVPVAANIAGIVNTLRAPFTVSSTGLLAYQAGAAASLRLVWYDRAGKLTGAVGDPAGIRILHLSPDRKMAALSVWTAGNNDIWIYDLSRGLRSRFTFDAASETGAVWSPDGKTIAFNSSRRGHYDLYRKAMNGTGAEDLLYADGADKYPTSWSHDGRYLLYDGTRSTGGIDIFALPLTGDGKPFPFVKTDFNQTSGQFSPDGGWVAFAANESGRSEIYVAQFPGPGGKRQVSVAGGSVPRWRADGRELFYIGPGQTLMAAEIGLKPGDAEVGAVRPLFGGLLAGIGFQYDVSADGQRFLAVALPENTDSSEPLTLVFNWPAGLKQ